MIAKKTVIGLAGVVAILAVAAFAGELVARGWAGRQVDIALSQPPFTRASHGTVAYSLWRGRLSIDALQLETALPSVPALRAAHVDFDGIGIFDLKNLGHRGSRLSGLTAKQLELAVPGGHESFGILTARGLQSKDLAPVGTAAMLFTVSAQRIDVSDFHGWHDGKSYDTRIESVTIEDASAGPLRGAAAASSDAPPATLAIATMTAVKVIHQSDGKSTTADRLEMTGLRLPADAAGPPPSDAPAAAWTAYLSRASVERLDAAQLAMSSPGGDHLSIDRIHAGPLAARRLDALEIDNLVAEGNTGHFRLGAFALENLAFDPGELPLKPPRVFLGRLRLADLAGGIKTDAEVTVREFLVTMEGDLNKKTAAALKVSGVQISTAAAPILRLIGYDRLSLEMSGRSTYDEKDGVVDSQSLIAAAEAGRLGVAMRLSNYPQEMSAPVMGALFMQLRETRLDRFELRYEDASLADHLLKLYGSLSGRDAEGMRAQLIAQVTARRDAYPGNAGVQQNLDRVIAFLRHPGAITVRLAPPKPVPFAELSMIFAQGDLGAAAERLGLSIE